MGRDRGCISALGTLQSAAAARSEQLEEPHSAHPTRPRVLQDEVFIIKLLPIDGLSSSAVVVGEVPSLTHELGDDAVEAAPLEAEAFLLSAEAAEVFCSGRGAEVSTARSPRAAGQQHRSPTVMGTTSDRSRILSRPAGLLPILMSM